MGWGRSASLLGKRDGELSGGIHLAGKQIGQSFGTANSGIPGFDNAGDVFDPRHGGGAAGFKHDDGFGVGGGHGFDQLVLIIGEGEGFQVRAFRFPLICEDDSDICLLCGGSGCGEVIAGDVRDLARGQLRR